MKRKVCIAKVMGDQRVLFWKDMQKGHYANTLCFNNKDISKQVNVIKYEKWTKDTYCLKFEKKKKTNRQADLILGKKMQLGKSMNLEKPNYFALCRKARRLILNLLITEDTEDKY